LAKAGLFLQRAQKKTSAAARAHKNLIIDGTLIGPAIKAPLDLPPMMRVSKTEILVPRGIRNLKAETRIIVKKFWPTWDKNVRN